MLKHTAPCPNRAAGWGTALQDGRSRVRFPIVSLLFFIELTFRPHYGPGVHSGSNTKEYQVQLFGGGGANAAGA